MDMMITDYEWSRIPWQLTGTASDWHDGEKTAMYAFATRKPANAEKLLREVRDCIRTFPDVSAKEMGKLKDLEAFALSHVTSAKAVRKLKAALMECAMAGAEIHQVDEWRRAAEREARDLRERQEAEAAAAEEEHAPTAPGVP